MWSCDFYKGKRVLVTGHTGFKGSWLCKLLLEFGAEVTGYGLEAETEPALFSLIHLENDMNNVIGDIRDFDHLRRVFDAVRPEIVFHLAAQPIVRDSYKNPRYTYETNVMGTVNLLECARHTDSIKSIVNITTDKVYRNREWCYGYRESDELNGLDPYSNSKSCSELVTHSFTESFFREAGVPVSTVRAGNVIGGGDFANDRIIPDCVRAMRDDRKIIVRNPNSVRPYQHVLEPLTAYMEIAGRQFANTEYAGAYNVGPGEENCITTGELADLFCKHWGEGATWQSGMEKSSLKEANYLKLDCSKIKSMFEWRPKWGIDAAVGKTCEFYKAWLRKENLSAMMERQMEEYLG